MKKQFVIATAVAALLAGTSLVSAQRGPEGSSNAPSASPASPADKAAPSANEPRNPSGSGMSPSGSRANDDKAAQGSPSQQDRRQTQSAPSQSPSQAQSPSQPTSPSQAQSPTQPMPSERNAAGTSQTNVNLSADQRTRIRETVVKQSNAPRVSRTEVNFNLNVGTVVPRTVHVVALPAPVIEIHPAWRGYSYFLVGDEIVIVEPGTLRIVAIIPA